MYQLYVFIVTLYSAYYCTYSWNSKALLKVEQVGSMKYFKVTEAWSPYHLQLCTIAKAKLLFQETNAPKFICPSPKVWDFDEKRLHWASIVRAVYHLLVQKTLPRNHLNYLIRKYIQPRHDIPQGQYKLSTYLFSLRISQCLLQKPFTIYIHILVQSFFLFSLTV